MRDGMTNRERVYAALEHKPVDRVPVMWWLNPHTAVMLINRYKKGPDRLGNWMAKRAWRYMNRRRVHPDLREGLALLLEMYAKTDYAVALGADSMDAYWGTYSYWTKKWWFENKRLHILDGYGITHKIVGVFLENIRYPIRGPKDLLEYKFPDVSDPKNFDPVRRFRRKYPNVFIIVPIPGVQDCSANMFVGIEKFYTMLMDYPGEVKEFQKKMVDHSLDIARAAVEAGADAVEILDDYGHQTSTFMSMPMWLEFTYPLLKRQIDAIHELGAKTMLHSCGHQMPLLKHYVDAGLDGLQAFQFAAGNDFEYAKRNYGKDLCFFTGIDVQMAQTRTPREIREDALRAWRIGKEGSGFALATTHNVQPVTPFDNIMEMIDTVHDIQSGRYD